MAGNGSTGRKYRGNCYRGGRRARVQFSEASPRRIWQPAVPEWEKKFCREIGLFQWEKFKEAKRYTHLYDKVMNWDDSAIQEAFHIAKNRFKAKLQGLPTIDDDALLTNADMYVEQEIDLKDSDEDLQLYRELDEIRECNKKQMYEEEKPAIEIRFEDIKPTGWDIDIEEINRQINNPVLTGMIVGE